MPEGRFLSKSIAWSEQVGSVSFVADYLFTRMIPHLDSAGRISGAPKAIKAMACPLRDDVTAEHVAAALEELVAAELIVWYRVGQQHFVEFPGFVNHQRGARLDREAPSRIPPPDGEGVEQVRTYSGVTPPSRGEVAAELPLSEVKRSEVKTPPAAGVRTIRTRTAPSGPAFSLSPYLDAYAERFPGSSVKSGRFGAALKPLETQHGPAEALERWQRFLAAKGELGPEYFARTWSEWGPVNGAVKRDDRPRVLAATEMLLE